MFCAFSGLEMTENGLSLILVYPPYRGFPTDEFYIQAFNDIYPYVEAVSVMTYDFSNPQKPGNCIFLFLILIPFINMLKFLVWQCKMDSRIKIIYFSNFRSQCPFVLDEVMSRETH